MADARSYPERPFLAVSAAIVRAGQVLVVRRARSPADGLFSLPGGVVEISLEGGLLSVRDHGPGFQEADLPFVFDRFYRADDARKLSGSGLGLAIVRQAAEACGGSVEAQNAPGGGALLRVSFGPAVRLQTPSTTVA